MSMLQRKLNQQGGGEPPRPESSTPAQASASAGAGAPTSNSSGAAPSAAQNQKEVTPPKIAYLRKRLRGQLLRSPDEADTWVRNDPEKIEMLTKRLRAVLEKAGAENADYQLSPTEFEQLRTALLDDLIGFGAIQVLVQDKGCSEIMVNGPHTIYGEYKGKVTLTPYEYDDEDHILHTAQRIVRPMGRQLNRENPMVDARLPDGSRVHIVTEPSALQGTTMTIRKFPEKRLDINDLINFGTLTPETAEFLDACVKCKLNIVVSGGTGSGKTTLLNILSGYIPASERIVTIEDAAELQLNQPHVVRLETAPAIPNTDGKRGLLAVRDLVRGSLRMRPDRIVIGECRGGEAIDMLQAMNTGHDGSLTTVHSNNSRDSIARLETLCLMAGMDLPVAVIRRQIVSAVNLIIQIARIKDGSRKIIQITEVQGMEGESVTLQDIFLYRLPGQTGLQPASTGGGKLEPTGFRPNFVDVLEENGFRLSGRIFGAGRQQFGNS